MTMLTLFCDASFDDRTGAGGWGAWAIRNGWPLGRIMGGAFWRKLPGPTYAELCAIVNALDTLDRSHDLDNVTELMVQSDCVAALNTIKNTPGVKAIISHHADSYMWSRTKVSKHEVVQEAQSALRDLVAHRKVLLRHVRGHQPGTGRGNVNAMCDRIAREHMEKARERWKENPDAV